jgi:hypothetical protein
MRVVVQVGAELAFPAWAPETVRLGDRVLMEGNPLRPGDRDVEGVVVHIGPGSVPARRVIEVLERYGCGPLGEEWRP